MFFRCKGQSVVAVVATPKLLFAVVKFSEAVVDVAAIAVAAPSVAANFSAASFKVRALAVNVSLHLSTSAPPPLPTPAPQASATILYHSDNLVTYSFAVLAAVKMSSVIFALFGAAAVLGAVFAAAVAGAAENSVSMSGSFLISWSNFKKVAHMSTHSANVSAPPVSLCAAPLQYGPAGPPFRPSELQFSAATLQASIADVYFSGSVAIYSWTADAGAVARNTAVRVAVFVISASTIVAILLVSRAAAVTYKVLNAAAYKPMNLSRNCLNNGAKFKYRANRLKHIAMARATSSQFLSTILEQSRFTNFV